MITARITFRMMNRDGTIDPRAGSTTVTGASKNEVLLMLANDWDMSTVEKIVFVAEKAPS